MEGEGVLNQGKSLQTSLTSGTLERGPSDTREQHLFSTTKQCKLIQDVGEWRKEFVNKIKRREECREIWDLEAWKSHLCLAANRER